MSITNQNHKSPVVESYAAEMRVAIERVENLAADPKHGPECQCTSCQAAWEVFEALQDNPPCPFCYGAGCLCCNHTGWR
jgi:hypothetical protein